MVYITYQQTEKLAVASQPSVELINQYVRNSGKNRIKISKYLIDFMIKYVTFEKSATISGFNIRIITYGTYH